MNLIYRCLGVSAISVLVISGCGRQVSFEKEVMPILSSSCLSCHDGSGEGSSESGFNVNSYADLMGGTKFGDVIVPGDSASSTIYRLVGHKASPSIQMPPHHDSTKASTKLKPLSSQEIETIKLWIDQGAQNN